MVKMTIETEEKERTLEEEIEELLKEADKLAEEGEKVASVIARAYKARELARHVDDDYKKDVYRRFKDIVTKAYSHEEQYLKEATSHIEKGHFRDAERCYGLALEAARHKSGDEREEVETKVYEKRREIALKRAEKAEELAEQEQYERAAALLDLAQSDVDDAYQQIKAQRKWANPRGQTQKFIDDKLEAKRGELKELEGKIKDGRAAVKKAKYTPMPEDVSFSELEDEVRASYPLKHYESRDVNTYWKNSVN